MPPLRSRYVNATPPVSTASGVGFELSRSGAAFGIIQGLAVIAWLVQLVLDAGTDNAIAASIILAASTATVQFLRVSRSFVAQPFSSLAVLGLCMTTQWGALVVQSGMWTPVGDYLRTPVKTFALLGGYQMMAVGGLWISAHLPQAAQLRSVFARRLLQPLGVFEMPSVERVWCLGLLGFVSLAAVLGLGGSGGVAGKLVAGLSFLTWAPFIIPLLAARQPGYCDMRRNMIGIGLYALVVVCLGMAVNARTLMFVGVMTVALLLLMLVLVSSARVRPAQLLKLIPAVMLAAIGVRFAADLATAAVLVRDQRTSASPLEMISLTVQALFDRSTMETFKDGLDTYSKLALYDEYYISNQVLARLIETKFHDNMFFLTEKMQPSELAELRQHTTDALWATLPEPVLAFWNIAIDKARLAFSVGDLLDYLHYGSDLGGFKIGSLFAHGQALFGYWFFAIYLAMCAIVFTVWDSFVRRDADGRVHYAPLAMMSVFGIFFNTISGDSFMVVIGFLVRGTAQTLIFYSIALAATRVAFPSKPSSPVPLPRVAPIQ